MENRVSANSGDCGKRLDDRKAERLPGLIGSSCARVPSRGDRVVDRMLQTVRSGGPRPLLVVILANGAPPRHALPRALLAQSDSAIACDGAVRTSRVLGREPNFVVGDGDSLTEDERRALGDRFVPIAEQDTNDLCKAFRFVRGRFAGTSIHLAILGATGLREDHTIGNIFHLADFVRDIPDTTLCTDTGIFVAFLGERVFDCEPREAVSVFAPEPGTRVISEGLEWPLAGIDLGPLWSGTLNRTTGRQFKLKTSRVLLVYRPYTP